MNDVITVSSADDIQKCWKAMQALRPHLAEEEFLPLVTGMMKEGFEMAYIAGDDGNAVAVVGFRYLQFLFNGKHIYIDDLSTLPGARGKGYGSKLIDHVCTIAKEKGYTSVTLDSGHHRTDAHRLYLNKGFNISAHHFTKKL